MVSKCLGWRCSDKDMTMIDPEVFERKAKLYNWGAKTVVTLGVLSGVAAGACAIAALILFFPLSGTVSTTILIATVVSAGAAGTVSFSLFVTGVGLKAGERKNLRWQIHALEKDRQSVSRDDAIKDLKGKVEKLENIKKDFRKYKKQTNKEIQTLKGQLQLNRLEGSDEDTSNAGEEKNKEEGEDADLLVNTA